MSRKQEIDMYTTYCLLNRVYRSFKEGGRKESKILLSTMVETEEELTGVVTSYDFKIGNIKYDKVTKHECRRLADAIMEISDLLTYGVFCVAKAFVEEFNGVDIDEK